MILFGRLSKWKAKECCKNTDAAVLDHFVDVTKMIKIGSGAERIQDDIMYYLHSFTISHTPYNIKLSAP